MPPTLLKGISLQEIRTGALAVPLVRWLCLWCASIAFGALAVPLMRSQCLNNALPVPTLVRLREALPLDVPFVLGRAG